MSHRNIFRRTSFRAALWIALALVLTSLTISAELQAAPNTTFTVTKTADTNDGTCNADCSLREAITAANANGAGADSITVPAGTYTLTIAGTGEDANATGDLDITGEVTINGAGASSTIIQAGTIGYPSGSANGIDRVIELHGTDTITFIGVTIANGKTGAPGGGIGVGDATLSVIESSFSGNSGTGGGIGNSSGTVIVSKSTFSNNSATTGAGIRTSAGTVVVSNSTFSNNSAPFGGGGIASYGGNVTVTNSTFSGNSANLGGGIMNNLLGTLTVTNSTFSANLATIDGGGIHNSGTLNLSNTILANSAGGGDCYNSSGDSIATNTANLIETNGPNGHMCGTPSVTTDPNLGALADNGGPTKTFAIDSTSPAYNAGDNTVCAAAPVSAKDQRGVTRPQNTTCDIGAFESNKQAGPILTVNTNEDSTDGFCDALVADVTDCTLREAIVAANAQGGANTIEFDGDQAIFLIAALPTLTGDTTIDGGTHRVELNGQESFRLLTLLSPITLNVNHLILSYGFADTELSYFNSGGAIYNESGTLNVTNSTLYANYAPKYGGAIFSGGATTISNSTFSANQADELGGGLAALDAVVISTTFSDNAAPSGAALSINNSLTLSNSILANSTGSDCNGPLPTGSNNLIESPSEDACNLANGVNGNLIGVDPILGLLGDNGGNIYTMALPANSPAIDAGDNATCAASPVSNLDQRGVTRPFGGRCDMGAFEKTATDCTSGEKPAKPTLLKPTQNQSMNKTKVKFDWGDAVCATSYKITVKNTTTGAKVTQTVIPSKATLTLAHGNQKWTVQACNVFGCTKSVKWKFSN